MNAPEFLVEFTKAYGNILANLWWPLVVLVIFFSLLYYFDRSLGSLGRRKRFPLTWKNMTQIVSQLERLYLTDMSPDGQNSQRQKLVHHHIQRAKRGLDRHDEQEIVKAIMELSNLGMHDDREIPQQIAQESTQWIDSESIPEESDKKESTRKRSTAKKT